MRELVLDELLRAQHAPGLVPQALLDELVVPFPVDADQIAIVAGALTESPR